MNRDTTGILQDIIRLWSEYYDETLSEANFAGFMGWLRDRDTDKNPYRYDRTCKNCGLRVRECIERKRHDNSL